MGVFFLNKIKSFSSRIKSKKKQLEDMDEIFKQNTAKTNLASVSSVTKEIKLTDDEEDDTKNKQARASINIQPPIVNKQSSFDEKPSTDSKVNQFCDIIYLRPIVLDKNTNFTIFTQLRMVYFFILRSHLYLSLNNICVLCDKELRSFP